MQCYFTANNIKYIDYKDVETLKKFVNQHGRIQNSRYSGVSAKYQRQLATAIKRARFMGLLPYINQ
ncbi:MAG: 30S ribosomal protein S18 [Candidatus Yonathbacteria bacterium]|nr:30S ribosomal protein S18 [Candidatus Yonathbacteria bacterium]